MKTARNQFGDAVGIALDAAVVDGVPAIELISYLGSYIDIVVFGGDLGMQTGPQISPAMYSEFFKPRHALIQEI